MKVSITLPSIYPGALHRALSNIAATTKNEYEVLVVSPFRVECPNVVWIEEAERRGCAAAHTTAFRHATGDFITATADDCSYQDGWDELAVANYMERSPKAGGMLCLGLHYGLLGTVFGIYYANFPFLRREDALKIDYFDGSYKRGFTDSDLSFKIWSMGGRCEFTPRKLIEITAEDKRKGGEDCPAEDLRFFVNRWGWRYGREFDVSYMRAINVDFDPELHPEFVDGFSVFGNDPGFVARLTMHSPPHLICSINSINVVKYRNLFYCAPHSLGSLNFESKIDREKPGIKVFDSLDEARVAARECGRRTLWRA